LAFMPQPYKFELKIYLYSEKGQLLVEILGKVFDAFTRVPNTKCVLTLIEVVENSRPCLLTNLPVLHLHTRKGDLFYSGDFSNVEKIARLLQLVEATMANCDQATHGLQALSEG
jgi:hypothetical protein